jgi:hypothetical protein
MIRSVALFLVVIVVASIPVRGADQELYFSRGINVPLALVKFLQGPAIEPALADNGFSR